MVEHADRGGMSRRSDRLLRAGLPRDRGPLYIPASFTVPAGHRAGRLTAPTLPHTHDPQVENIPTFADSRTRARPAQTPPAQHSTTMPQQTPVVPAHRPGSPDETGHTSGEPRSGTTREAV
jgi:hypothetical protein